MEFSLNQHEIPDVHLAQVCKYRHGSQCCRYIVFLESHGRFVCAKKVNDLKQKIDSQADKMNAQGDNCEGLPNETA